MLSMGGRDLGRNDLRRGVRATRSNAHHAFWRGQFHVDGHCNNTASPVNAQTIAARILAESRVHLEWSSENRPHLGSPEAARVCFHQTTSTIVTNTIRTQTRRIPRLHPSLTVSCISNKETRLYWPKRAPGNARTTSGNLRGRSIYSILASRTTADGKDWTDPGALFSRIWRRHWTLGNDASRRTQRRKSTGNRGDYS
jgi:hypothetical protein